MHSLLILFILGLTLFINVFAGDVSPKKDKTIYSTAYFAEDGKWGHLVRCKWRLCEMYGSFRLDCYRMWEMTMALESWMLYQEAKAKGLPEEMLLKLLAAKPIFTKNGQHGQVEMTHEEVIGELINFHYKMLNGDPVVSVLSIPISWMVSPVHQLVGSKVTKLAPIWPNQKQCEMVHELDEAEQALKNQQQQQGSRTRPHLEKQLLATSSATNDAIHESKSKLRDLKAKIDHESTLMWTGNVDVELPKKHHNALVMSLKAYSNIATKSFAWFRPKFTKEEVEAAKNKSDDEKEKESKIELDS